MKVMLIRESRISLSQSLQLYSIIAYAFINNANDEDYKKYKNLDIRIHNLNGKRTNGLLTGPYLSKVISEAILARVDEDLKACNLVFTRYADDYEFAVYDKNEVNKIKAIVADIFDKYFFRINNEKTRYEEYPFYTFSNFEKMLGTTENEKADIEIVELFNRFWALEKKGEKGAVRYLLKAYQDKYRVQDEYVYTNYLINVLCNDEKALGLSCEIIIREYEKNRVFIDETTKAVIIKKLSRELNNNHEHEVIWLVYLCKYIHIDLGDDLFNKLWDSDFELLKVMLLYEYKDKISSEMRIDALDKAKSWILLYELSFSINDSEGFINRLNVRHSKEFYKKLFQNQYSFYQCRNVTNGLEQGIFGTNLQLPVFQIEPSL